MVELIADAVDYGDAPEIFISGAAWLACVSANIVRTSYYELREGPHGIEKRIVLHCLREAGPFAADLPLIGRTLDFARRQCAAVMLPPPMSIHRLAH